MSRASSVSKVCSCGSSIPKERLRAIPDCERCVSCQRAFEKSLRFGSSAAVYRQISDEKHAVKLATAGGISVGVYMSKLDPDQIREAMKDNTAIGGYGH